MNSTEPDAYFSINGGTTALSYFSATDGSDFADWLSNCTDATFCTDGIPDGFGPQVQDAFGLPGSESDFGRE